APSANIILVVARTNFGSDLSNAVSFAVKNKLGNVVSMSFDEPERLIPGGASNPNVQLDVASAQLASANNITLVASAGDFGANWAAITDGSVAPSADPPDIPQVLGVGGTNLFTGGVPVPPNATGTPPQYTWNDSVAALCPFGCLPGIFGATGGAPSAF